MSYVQFFIGPGVRITHIGSYELPEICMSDDLATTYPQHGFSLTATDPLEPPQETWLVQNSNNPESSVTSVEDGEVEAESIVGPTPGKKPPHA